jgi:hypothetical protein
MVGCWRRPCSTCYGGDKAGDLVVQALLRGSRRRRRGRRRAAGLAAGCHGRSNPQLLFTFISSTAMTAALFFFLLLLPLLLLLLLKTMLPLPWALAEARLLRRLRSPRRGWLRGPGHRSCASHGAPACPLRASVRCRQGFYSLRTMARPEQHSRADWRCKSRPPKEHGRSAYAVAAQVQLSADPRAANCAFEAAA